MDNFMPSIHCTSTFVPSLLGVFLRPVFDSLHYPVLIPVPGYIFSCAQPLGPISIQLVISTMVLILSWFPTLLHSLLLSPLIMVIFFIVDLSNIVCAINTFMVHFILLSPHIHIFRLNYEYRIMKSQTNRFY